MNFHICHVQNCRKSAEHVAVNGFLQVSASQLHEESLLLLPPISAAC